MGKQSIVRRDVVDLEPPITLKVPETLTQWVSRVSDIGCDTIELRCLGDKGSAQNVATFRLVNEEAFNAEEIMLRMQQDADALGGSQRYMLLAFMPASKVQRERHIIEVDGGASNDFAASGRSNDSANLAGIVTHFMKHNENYAEALIRSQAQGFESLVKMNRYLSNALAKEQEENAQLRIALLDSRSLDIEKIEREHALKADELKMATIHQAAKMIIPALVSKFAPQSQEVKDEAITQFLGSLSGEQTSTIMGVLAPEQLALLGALINKAEKHEAKSEGVANG